MNAAENENTDPIQQFRSELVSIVIKSQEAFERQLTYISAGSLALSMGFIKDVVGDLQKTDGRSLLVIGWGLLAFTLIANCISHIRAVQLHNRSIGEINYDEYDEVRIQKRSKEISRVNWLTVFLLLSGLSFIIIFVSINVL